MTRLVFGLLAAMVALTACSSPDNDRESPADRVSRPAAGGCATLTPELVSRSSDSTEPVDCTSKHTAETFLTSSFPERFADTRYDSKALGRHVFAVCDPRFHTWLGGDESIAMRSMLSWAWFRPSEEAWRDGARWFRCDVVGGPEGATSYRTLPKTTKGLFRARPPQQWTLCARGDAFEGSTKVACSSAHNWRAVTTIRVGPDDEKYPGDRVNQVRSDQFCADSVGGWLGYPTTDYDYGVTVFHAAEWQAGNRRSICWARTTK